MKQFKIIDFWVSVILIVASVVFVLVKRNIEIGFIYCYFIVGGWQVISMITHAVNGWFVGKKMLRFYYHWFTLLAIITMPLGSIFLLLYIAPLLAIIYTLICRDELFRKMKRPLDVLK